MFKKNYILFFVFLFLCIPCAYSSVKKNTSQPILYYNEKLNFKIIDFSHSQKTVLISRGLEDGLKNNTILNLFNSLNKLVAIAIVRKTKTTKSILSILTTDKKIIFKKQLSLNLSLARKRKITKDITKSIDFNNLAKKYTNKKNKI